MSKTVGDLAGPLSFALLMGLSRLVYAAYSRSHPSPHRLYDGQHRPVHRRIPAGLPLPWPALALVGAPCAAWRWAACGRAPLVWRQPVFPAAAPPLFALLALAGDLGCSAGPGLVGLVSSAWGDHLQYGLLAAAVFPLLLLAGLAVLRKALARQN